MCSPILSPGVPGARARPRRERRRAAAARGHASGSVALSLCTAAHPLRTRIANRFGTAISETTMRPNPRHALPRAVVHQRDALEPRHRGGPLRARSHCRVVRPLIRLIPAPRTYSVPIFLKRQCDRTLGHLLQRAALRQGGIFIDVPNQFGVPSV
jgi:hypothetical protein